MVDRTPDWLDSRMLRSAPERRTLPVVLPAIFMMGRIALGATHLGFVQGIGADRANTLFPRSSWGSNKQAIELFLLQHKLPAGGLFQDANSLGQILRDSQYFEDPIQYFAARFDPKVETWALFQDAVCS